MTPTPCFRIAMVVAITQVTLLPNMGVNAFGFGICKAIHNGLKTIKFILKLKGYRQPI
jgi:hypothetical protein